MRIVAVHTLYMGRVPQRRSRRIFVKRRRGRAKELHPFLGTRHKDRLMVLTESQVHGRAIACGVGILLKFCADVRRVGARRDRIEGIIVLTLRFVA
jgi:hypothetical protein